MTSRGLQNCYIDKVNDDANENNDAGNYIINNNKATTSKSFDYNKKIIGNTPADNNTLDTEDVTLSKYLVSQLYLVHCEVELDLSL